VIISDENYLVHYGILRKSGRYPWGSGGNQDARNRSFLDYVDGMRAQGMSDTEIARGIGLLDPDSKFNTSDFRASLSIARAEVRASNIAQVERMRNVKGMSTQAISDRLGIPEPTVRSYLKPGAKERTDATKNIADMLEMNVEKQGFIDVGSGVENHIGVSADRLKVATSMLKERGYKVHTVQVNQLGTAPGQKTLVKVVGPKESTYLDAKRAVEAGKVGLTFHHTNDNGRTMLGLVPPLSIDSKRVGIRYKEDGGDKEDGTIYVRRGVEDVSLGSNRYAQVRVMVNDTHYLKGMAFYKDDMPPGVDLVFNTNKSNTGSKLDAMKKIKDDPDNPFGSYIKRQLPKLDKDGNEIPNTVRSAMNLVNEEGDWYDWSRTLSSQMLSKQKPALIKQQLDMTYDRKRSELDEINSLTNSTVRKKLLREFGEEADTASAHLKAAGLKRMQSHVILPIPSLKDNEIYAPNYKDGETVVLIRYPHGGTFEIPELRVNNSNREGKSVITGSAIDAVGINPKTAARLSGADFDGDTVVVIPNPRTAKNRITSSPPLEGLKNFDPQSAFPGYEGMPKLTEGRKQQLMGDVSNLITDMTIKGASQDQIARAVRHSMVVIDAAKHDLNYKESERVNGIRQLKEEFQGAGVGNSRGAASTIVSRKGSVKIAVPERKLSYDIDPATGKKIYRETGRTWVNEKGETVTPVSRVKAIRELDDVSPLSSGTVVESLYVSHSNKLKALGNEARKEEVRTKGVRLNPGAKKVYKKEVDDLNAKLNLALRNRPLERQAQIVAGAEVSARRAADPNMTKDEVKKVERQALEAARLRTGAKKAQIVIEPNEWKAIQSGAVSNKMLTDILNNADMDVVRELATPRTKLLMTSSKQARAEAMLAQGYTQAQVAEQLGVSLTTLKDSL
jgi:DNA-binding CsgD family transcriptional regulator